MHTEEFEAKHETNFIHDGAPSYDPAVYRGTFPARFHIKTMQVGLPQAVSNMQQQPAAEWQGDR